MKESNQRGTFHIIKDSTQKKELNSSVEALEAVLPYTVNKFIYNTSTYMTLYIKKLGQVGTFQVAKICLSLIKC